MASGTEIPDWAPPWWYPWHPWYQPSLIPLPVTEQHYKDLAAAALLLDTHKENRRLKEAMEAAVEALRVAEGFITE